MADHYTQFSAALTRLTSEETAWLADQLDPDRGERPCWHEEDDEEPDFEWGFQGDLLALWSMRGQGSCLDQVGALVRDFLARYRPDSSWTLTFAVTCSRPMLDQFAGGALFVTADGVEYHNSDRWLAERIGAKRAGSTATPDGSTDKE